MSEKVRDNKFYRKGEKDMMGGADSGCMPNGRRTADESGSGVMPWKEDGTRSRDRTDGKSPVRGGKGQPYGG